MQTPLEASARRAAKLPLQLCSRKASSSWSLQAITVEREAKAVDACYAKTSADEVIFWHGNDLIWGCLQQYDFATFLCSTFATRYWFLLYYFFEIQYTVFFAIVVQKCRTSYVKFGFIHAQKYNIKCSYSPIQQGRRHLVYLEKFRKVVKYKNKDRWNKNKKMFFSLCK